MALTVTANFPVTPTTGHATGARSAPVQNVNWAADWVMRSQTGSEAQLVNANSPIDAKNRIRIQLGDIANVYTGTGIIPSYQLPSKQGVSLLVQNTGVWDVTDSSDAQFRAQLPFSAHIVVKVPKTNLLTTAQIGQAVGQLFGALGKTDAASGNYDGLGYLLNGAINPVLWT